MKILSCIPKQLHSFTGKLNWIEKMAKKYHPDIFVTPQEFFGGIQVLLFKTKEKVSYKEEEIIKPIHSLAKKFNMGIVTGAVIDDEKIHQRRERIFVIDPQKGLTGHYDKIMLPAYDHVKAKGKTMVFPEPDLKTRSRLAYIKGAGVNILFCWEVYSNYIWHEICKSRPDFLITMIKFGVSSYPKKAKDEKTKESIVTGFGYGGDGGWIDRLKMGCRFDICAPVVCSTNSWGLKNRARPLCGTIFPFKDDTLYFPEKGKRGNIEEKIIVDEIDYLTSRYNHGNKFVQHDATGEWQASEVRTMTMLWKIKRMERKMIGLSNRISGTVDDKQPDLI